MSYSVWASFFSYNFITHITPGPNNIVALNAAGNVGLRNSRSILVGMFSGLHVLLLLCGLFSAALASLLPEYMHIIRYLGAAYILWLAFDVARSKPDTAGGSLAGMTFLRGFLLQFANVKAILYGVSVFTIYILPHYQGFWAIIGFSVLMAGMANLCSILWATAGMAMKHLFTTHRHTVNLIMAFMLVGSALSILLG